MRKHSCETLDDFFAAIGYGGVQLSKVMQRLKVEYTKKYSEKQQPEVTQDDIKPKSIKKKSGVVVDGIDDCVVKFAQCCNPLPGDDVVGFITRGHGVSVHKCDCANYLSQKDDPDQKDRWIPVHWESSKTDPVYFKTTLDIIAVDRIGLLADVSSAPRYDKYLYIRILLARAEKRQRYPLSNAQRSGHGSAKQRCREDKEDKERNIR